MKRGVSSKRLLLKCLPVVMMAGVLLPGGVAHAAASITVSPSTGLSNGQTVTVSGSGFPANSPGAIVQCNGASGQPTVTVAGNAAPVSCTNPLSKIVTTDANGNLPATPFTVRTGTVGPPASGTDSSGGSSAADAANYPCPPTAAQIAAGATCTISFGTATGPQLSQPITFASQSKPAPTAPTTPPPAAPTEPKSPTTTPKPSPKPHAQTPTKLTNTGPGETIALFFGTVAVASLARYLHFRHYVSL